MAILLSILSDQPIPNVALRWQKKMKVSKNDLINRALTHYLEALERQQYIDSFKKLAGDKELLNLAEEGMEDYYIQLEEYEKK
jgi:ribosomal protein L10